MGFPYDVEKEPPAPMADVHITISLPAYVDASISESPVKHVRALLDTGSDISVVPKSIIDEIEDELGIKLKYNFNAIQSVNGKKYRRSYELDVLKGKHECFNEKTSLRFVVFEGDLTILGRNFLREYSLNFDGPKEKWSFRGLSEK